MKQASLFESIQESVARAVINARIELAAQEAIDEIRTAASEATKFINYSAGQNARRMRERVSRHG